MSDLYSPTVSHDPLLAYGANMTDCDLCGISGWCGIHCPVFLEGWCDCAEEFAEELEEPHDD